MHRFKSFGAFVLVAAALWLVTGTTAIAATEETKREAIDDGLVWLIGEQIVSGDEGYWSYGEGTLAATGAAALAFIEEGFLPGEDVVIGVAPDTTNYGDVVGRAVTYIFNRAVVDSRFGPETGGYWHYAEDYDNDGPDPDGGNDQAIFFEPGVSSRRLYTTGICTPVVFALGEALGIGAVIDRGSAAVNGRTYAAVMQDLVDWFCFAQVEPTQGSQRGGWRYDANWPDSDNSTAQWGSLPLLYADAWGLPTPDYVYEELELWVNYIQNANGGSGYSNPDEIVNVAKTGGLLLELAAIGAAIDDSRVQDAIAFINSRWNNGPSGWYGNLNHPYAMWAVYKGLEVYELMDEFWSGDPDSSLVRYGFGVPAAPGGFEIGRVGDTQTSAAGDWYSHYSQYLVNIQNANGGWNGYSYWTGPLATAWYINILRASAGVHRLADPDIQITSIIDGPCVWYQTPVTHTIRYWFGTPGFPDPDILPAENVEVTITLSPHLTFVSATGDYSWDGAQTVTWTRAEVPDGSEYFETIVTVGAGTVEPVIELVTFADISATNVPAELWDHDESRVITCNISTVDVPLDIKPGSCPNPVNIKSKGVIPVAVLGTVDFDVTQIDVDTVLLEGVAPIRTGLSDVGSPFDGVLCDCHAGAPDGYTDLTLKFRTQDLVAVLGTVTDREERILTLTGTLFDDTLIEGRDCIRILVPAHEPEAPALERVPAGIQLAWDGSGGPHFASYAVYRGATEEFLPETAEDYLALSVEPLFVDDTADPGETWYYRVGVFDEPIEVETPDGPETVTVFSGYSESSGMLASTDATGPGRPAELSLLPATPNPFRSSARITYTLPTATRVRLSMYDVAGRLVDRLVDGNRPAGTHVARLDGDHLPSGLYFIRLEANERIFTRRVTLMR